MRYEYVRNKQPLVHRFVFDNETYASRFSRENSGEVVAALPGATQKRRAGVELRGPEEARREQEPLTESKRASGESVEVEKERNAEPEADVPVATPKFQEGGGATRSVIDLRQTDEVRLQQEAQRSLPGEDERLAQSLVQLLEAADQQYKGDKTAYAATCSAIQEIGNRLCSNGGTNRMKRVAYRVKSLGGNSRLIEMHWDGICGWQY